MREKNSGKYWARKRGENKNRFLCIASQARKVSRVSRRSAINSIKPLAASSSLSQRDLDRVSERATSTSRKVFFNHPFGFIHSLTATSSFFLPHVIYLHCTVCVCKKVFRFSFSGPSLFFFFILSFFLVPHRVVSKKNVTAGKRYIRPNLLRFIIDVPSLS